MMMSGGGGGRKDITWTHKVPNEFTKARKQGLRRLACVMSEEHAKREEEEIVSLLEGEENVTVYNVSLMSVLYATTEWSTIRNMEDAFDYATVKWVGIESNFRGDETTTELTRHWIWLKALLNYITKRANSTVCDYYFNVVGNSTCYKIITSHEKIAELEGTYDYYHIRGMISFLDWNDPNVSLYMFTHVDISVFYGKLGYLSCVERVAIDFPNVEKARIIARDTYFFGCTEFRQSHEKAIQYGMDPTLCVPTEPSNVTVSIFLIVMIASKMRSQTGHVLLLRHVCRHWNTIVLTKCNDFWLRFNIMPNTIRYPKDGFGQFVIDQVQCRDALKKAEKREAGAIANIGKCVEKIANNKAMLAYEKRRLREVKIEKKEAKKKIKF